MFLLNCLVLQFTCQALFDLCFSVFYVDVCLLMSLSAGIWYFCLNWLLFFCQGSLVHCSGKTITSTWPPKLYFLPPAIWWYLLLSYPFCFNFFPSCINFPNLLPYSPVLPYFFPFLSQSLSLFIFIFSHFSQGDIDRYFLPREGGIPIKHFCGFALLSADLRAL